jgi:OFA family oxalate/formate antiporter-like MFS transporter
VVSRSARSAVGLTAAGYGAGAALTVLPVRYVIDTSGYEAAFLWFGLFQGGIVFILAWFLRAPEPGEMAAAPAAKVAQSSRNYTPGEVMASPIFWILYVMFVMVSASGLMATAQIAPIAKDFNVANTIIFFGATRSVWEPGLTGCWGRLAPRRGLSCSLQR